MPGIERSRFKRQPVHPDFLCNLCGEVLWQPLQSNLCQHVFCSECITKWLSEQSSHNFCSENSDNSSLKIAHTGSCPIDQSSLSRNDLSELPRDLFQSLAILEVKCDYYSNGCQSFIRLEKLSKHVDHCLYNPDRSIRSKIETILKVQKSLSSSYVKQLLKLLDEKEKIVNEQEGLINKILEEGSDLDQVVQQFIQEKSKLEREKLTELEMMESVIRKLQDENDDLRERLHRTQQKLFQSNLSDLSQLTGQQEHLVIYSDGSTTNSCESLSMSSKQVLSISQGNERVQSRTGTMTPPIQVSRKNSSRTSSLVPVNVRSVSPSHQTFMKKVRDQLCGTTYNIMKFVDLADFYDFDPYNLSWALYVSSRLQRVMDVVNEGNKVLVLSPLADLYIPVCLSLFVGSNGLVVTRSTSEFDVTKISKNHLHLLESGRLILAKDEPDSSVISEGFPSESPFDVIFVPKEHFTLELEEQRKPDGIAFDPYTNTNLTPNFVPQFA